MQKIVLIIHNVRSCHNVGSLLRTADGLGITKLYMCGYTPYPQTPDDDRLPHISQRATKQIQKTALGAEETVEWSHCKNLPALIQKLKTDGYIIAALEQSDESVKLPEYKSSQNVALIVGSEVEGIDSSTLKLVDITLEIPMFGSKESFNVASAAAIALYHLRFFTQQT